MFSLGYSSKIAHVGLHQFPRIESKAEVKRKVVQELHKSGAWQQMRDEMKSRVLKIAAEKFRLGKKNAIATGKFEFCNALYVKLMEEVHTSLGDMFLKVNVRESHYLTEMLLSTYTRYTYICYWCGLYDCTVTSHIFHLCST
jgi:hypothetical protein